MKQEASSVGSGRKRIHPSAIESPMRMPLAGIRVLDLGTITAGAATSALLADAGAEVIKIEAPNRPDPFRKWSKETAEGGGKSSPVFDFSNRNKLGVALDLKTEKGRQVFLDMVGHADVVVENFRRGVLEKLGISFADLKAVNPAIVLASISSQGETGPNRGQVSFGSTLEATNGLAALTGYQDGPPMITGRILNYPDQIVGIFAMGMIVTGLSQARETGSAVHLDISQGEVTTFVIGEYIAQCNHPSPSTEARIGNSDPDGRTQIVAKSASGDWVAVSALSAEQEHALARLVGPEPDLAAWIEGQTTETAVKVLAETGAACAKVAVGSEVMKDLSSRASSAFDSCPNGALAKGYPFQSRRKRMSIHTDAPDVGRDTENVLRTVLGLSEEEISDLFAAKSIA